jgi:hypothetical protein
LATGNASVTIARVRANMTAPPTPWTARAAISSAGVGDSAHAIEAAVKTAMPARNIRLRP